MAERHTFTPVQILAMLFSRLKQTAEKSLETPVSDCVIGIPSYFTDLQRRHYLDAAEIAGLKLLRLMHDCTATALGYGIYKSNFFNSDATYVVFVDIGHSDTQVAVSCVLKVTIYLLSLVIDETVFASAQWVDPIESRYEEEVSRAQATRDLFDSIVDFCMAAESLPAAKKDAVLTERNEAEQWLRDKMQQEDSLPKNVDPVLLSSNLRRKIEALDGYYSE
ncbi:hypothetical protein Ancab_033495 [Ancistrocladus abbreviatus]